MLKFVTTKNFKMPGNHQCLGIKVKRDSAGNLVQTERWTESVVIPGAGGEDRKVDVPFTKTYTTIEDQNKRVMTVVEEVTSSYLPSNYMSEKLPCMFGKSSLQSPHVQGDAGRKGSVFCTLYKPNVGLRTLNTVIEEDVKPGATSIKSSQELPVVIGATPKKGTVFDTLRKQTTQHYSHSSYTKLHKKRSPLTLATSVPVLPGVELESFIKIHERAMDIMVDRLGSKDGEVVEATPMNTKFNSVKEFVKHLDAQCQKDTKNVFRNTPTASFVHAVEIPKQVYLTSR